MRNIRFNFAAFAMAMLFFACQKPEPVVPDAPDDPENENGFVEAVPDTVTFTNSQLQLNAKFDENQSADPAISHQEHSSVATW